MDFFIRGVLFFLLQNVAVCYQPTPPPPQSTGCTHILTECIYKVHCIKYVDLNEEIFRLPSRYMGYNGDGYDGCPDDTRMTFNSGEFRKIHLTYENSDTVDSYLPKQVVPPWSPSNSNRYYSSGDIFYKLIVVLDISNNQYSIFPRLKNMPHLTSLKLSSNSITVATLSNENKFPELNEIDLSHNSISSIQIVSTQFPFTSLKHLNLSKNYLVDLPDSIFENFSQLTTLDLSHNYIDIISVATFEGIKKLTSLYLSDNRLKDIDNAFFRFSELKILDLSYNRIEHVKLQDFDKLTNLQTLLLNFNSIIRIDSCTFCNMEFLEIINLEHNKLSTLNKDLFVNSHHLASVDISYNNFNVLPIGLFKGKNIRDFFVDGNYLKDSLKEGTFEGLNMVTTLDLKFQHLTSLEDYAFHGLDGLKILLLSNNEINNIMPNCFRSLNNLYRLDLSNNNITYLNINTSDLFNLQVFLLKNNYLTHIRHDQFLGLNSLNYLDLTNNQISQFESNSFSQLQNLINLKISNNPLNGTLVEKTFDGLNSLPTLSVFFTDLTAIENGSFIGMLQLKELNMSHSKICELQHNAFSQTGAIEIIDLSYNQLSTFNVNCTDLKHLGVLLLNNNLLKSVTEFSFLGLSRLSNLSLSHNNIKSIQSQAFNDQEDLAYLDLSYNIEMNFDISLLSKNKNLYNLRLSGNRNRITFEHINDTILSTLEVSFVGIKNITDMNLKGLIRLENLFISNNDIAKLEVGAFKNLSELRQLDLSCNKIEYIQPGVFKDNIHLDLLNISHNSLASVSYGIFRGLIYLTTLDMSYNELNSLETERFFEVISLRTLIVDNNKIGSFSAADFAGTHLSTLSIGNNPLPCELLVNIQKHPPTFVITALKLNEHEGENIYGVTCNMNGYVYHKESNNEHSDEQNKVLVDIKELLVKIANKNIETDKSGEQDKSWQNIRNLTDYDQIMNKYHKEFSNLTSLLTVQSNNTNLLLAKILTVLSVKPIKTSTPIPTPIDNSTQALVAYINKIKEELENIIAAEKENILNELETKVSIVNSQMSPSTRSPNVTVQSKLSAKHDEPNYKRSIFTETCVALILAILVCLVLYKFYRSRIYVQARRSYSTRELPGAMDSQDL